MIEYFKPEINYNEISDEKIIISNLKEISKSFSDYYGKDKYEFDDKFDYQLSDLIDELSDFVIYNIIGLCGCGNINSVIIVINKYLNILREWNKNVEDNIDSEKLSDIRKYQLLDKFNVESEVDNPLLAFMVYILDDKELIEHGSSITGAYLNDLGYVCNYIFTIYINYI